MHAAVSLSLLMLCLVCAGVALGLGVRLTNEDDQLQWWRWLLPWWLKGWLTPMVLWALINLGLGWWIQPFMPQVQAAQNAGKGWLGVYLLVLARGAFIVTSCWAALTLGWSLARAGQAAQGEPRAKFRSLCLAGGLGMLIPALLLLLLGGWPVTGLAALALLAPIAGYAPGVLHPAQGPPSYARAIARMKFGKYAEAEWEIIRELEKCENDFQGWLMMAELYANHFHDLAEAEQTILEICDHPRTGPSQLSVALHRLADWHLKIGNDPDAARRALQMVCDRLPGTHLAHMAQMRINQLPGTVQELQERQAVRPIPLPALSDALYEPGLSPPPPDAKEAATRMQQYKAMLEHNPHDAPTREKLARLLAQLGKPQAAIEHLRLLLDAADPSEVRQAEWLGLIAAWQLKHLREPRAARATFEQIIRQFPNTPQALAAQRRLRLLDQG